MENCPSLKCFYAILGVGKDSSCADIRSAYRKLAMKWHPDKCARAKGDVQEQAKLKFQVVQEAYAVLSDENKRFCYDAGLHEEVKADPGMQDFMAELAKKMSEECSVSTESNANDEFEELKKFFMNMVDTDTYLQECEKFGLSSRNSDPVHFQEAKPQSPTANTSNRSRHFFSFPRTHGDSSQGISVAEQRGNSTYGYDEPSPPCPDAHADLWAEERHGFDFHAGRSFSNLEQPAQRFSDVDFTSLKISSECPLQTHASPPSTPTNLNAERFCMGVGGDDSVKHHRGQGRRHAKTRRRRSKDKGTGAPPPSTCDVCGQEQLGIGPGCLCKNRGVNSESGSSFFVS